MTKKKKIVIGICISLLLLGAILFLFLYNYGYSGIHKHTKAKEGQIKVACVGDSITYGHGIRDWENNNYPAQLQEILGDGYHVENFGHSGRTLSSSGDKPYTESEQYKLSLEYDADVVVIMLGTNDSKPKNWTSELDFIKEYENLINSYKKNNPNVKIILCTPARAFFPNGKSEGKTSYDIQPSVVERIKNEIRTFAFIENYELVDIYGITEYHREWFKDNVHPNGDGARAMAEAIAKKITDK